jgi:hypothetical protein
MAWKVRSSNKMLILGMVFFGIGFTLITLFPTFMSFYPSNRIVGWSWAILVSIFFELGLFSIIVVKIRDAIITMTALFIWSLVVLVPVPQGYEEPIYGGALILMVATMILYSKYKSKNNKN